MSTHAPDLPIEVDDDTGVWTTNNLPMLYVPRHFFLNNHMMVEGAIALVVGYDWEHVHNVRTS